MSVSSGALSAGGACSTEARERVVVATKAAGEAVPAGSPASDQAAAAPRAARADPPRQHRLQRPACDFGAFGLVHELGGDRNF
jgi:hypothetical protein